MSVQTPSSADWSIQQDRPEQYAPPVRLIWHIVSFLQWRFSLLPVGAYHWAPEDLAAVDAGGSEIYISGDTPLPAHAVGDRPAISVQRSSVGFQGSGLGDMAFHHWPTGSKAYMDLIPTTLVISVLSRLAFVAERLAWFVQEQIFTLREEIVRKEKSILTLGSRAQLSPPQPAMGLIDASESDWMMVQIMMPAYLQHATAFVPLNRPVVQKIDVVLRSDDKK